MFMCTSYNYMNNLCSLYWDICILTSILVQVFNLAFSKSALLKYTVTLYFNNLL